MNDSRINNINEISEFLKGAEKVQINFKNTEDKYNFINKTIKKFKYTKLPRKNKKLVFLYIKKLTGYKKSHLYRLIKQAIYHKLKHKVYIRNNPNRKYTAYDIKLLEKTDELHKRLNVFATKEIIRREFEIFGNSNYENIAGVSPSHINNLRDSNAYKSSWINHTKSKTTPIGTIKKPDNRGIPGSIRVDTVHQNNVYHINAVDEITQWEVLVCVPQISIHFLEPAFYDLILQFPFVIFNFHSDRGGEFINYTVEKILSEFLIDQTKSRARHCNDNALVESKNASVVRKNMGHFYVNQNMSNKVNEYFKNYLNVYINYHRPCMFVTEIQVDKKGREKPTYGQTVTPYEKLKLIAKSQKVNFLRDEMDFKKLDEIAYEKSDNEFAEILRKEESKLFDLIHRNT